MLTAGPGHPGVLYSIYEPHGFGGSPFPVRPRPALAAVPVVPCVASRRHIVRCGSTFASICNEM